MPRHPDQTRDALKKDLKRIDLILERARRNSVRDESVNKEIIAKLSWVKLKLAEEAHARRGPVTNG